MDSKTCLITGGTGLLGSSLISKLKDWKIYVLSKSNFESSEYQVIQADLSDENFVDLLPKKMDAVIHLAQSNHFKELPQKALDVFSINTQATLKLLDYARKAEVKNFIYASSGAVYGFGPKPFVENDPLLVKPELGLYYASKLSSELLVESYSPYFTTAILRFFFIYGPGQREQMLIPRLVQSIKKGQTIKLQGENGLRINPIYVSDAAEAVKASLELKESSKVNIAGLEVLSLRDIGNHVAESLQMKCQFDQVDNALPNDLIADTQQLCRLLVKPVVKFQDGIKAYLETLHSCIPC